MEEQAVQHEVLPAAGRRAGTFGEERRNRASLFRTDKDIIVSIFALAKSDRVIRLKRIQKGKLSMWQSNVGQKINYNVKEGKR
jgi:hypothetical protein